MFFNSKQYIHGRRGIINQIFQGLSLDKMVKKRLPEMLDRMIDYNFKSLITSFDKDQGSRNCLIKASKLDINQLSQSITSLLENHGLINNSILSSERAIINHRGKYFLSYIYKLYIIFY